MAMFKRKKQQPRATRVRGRRKRKLRYVAARSVDVRRYAVAVGMLLGGVVLFLSFRHMVASLKTLSMIPPFVYHEKLLHSNTTTIPAAELQRYLNEHLIGIFNAAKHCERLKATYPEIADIRCSYAPPAALRVALTAKKPVLFRFGDPPVFYSESGGSFTVRDPQSLKGRVVQFASTGDVDPYPAVAVVNYLGSLGLADRLKRIEGVPNGEMVLVLHNGSRIIADAGFPTNKPSAVRTVFDLAASSDTDVYARLLDDGRIVVRERGRGAR